MAIDDLMTSFETYMESESLRAFIDDANKAAFVAAWRGWRPKLTKLSTNLVSSVRDVYQPKNVSRNPQAEFFGLDFVKN